MWNVESQEEIWSFECGDLEVLCYMGYVILKKLNDQNILSMIDGSV